MINHPEAVPLPVTLDQVWWNCPATKVAVTGTVRAMWLVTDRKPPSSGEYQRDLPAVHLFVERADSRALVTVAADSVRTGNPPVAPVVEVQVSEP